MFSIPIPEGVRGFYDAVKLRTWINHDVKDSFDKALNKIETDHFKLKATNLEYDKDRMHYTPKQQKEAIFNRTDLQTPLRATIQLIDKRTGKVVDEKKSLIANIPYVTDRNTAILNGSEYIVVGQQRLKPGVYTRIKESGEAEAHVNVKAGTGWSGKIIFYPERALFVYVLGATQIKLYGLLKDLGTSDAAMEAAWGKEIFDKNRAGYGGDEVDKFYSKVFDPH